MRTSRKYSSPFYADEPQFQTDAAWYRLVEEADNALLRGGGPEGGIAGFVVSGPLDDRLRVVVVVIIAEPPVAAYLP